MIPLLFSSFSIFAIPRSAYQQAPQDQVTTSETLKTLKQSIKDVENALTEKQRQESAAQIALRDIEKEIGANEEKMRAIQANITEKQVALDALEEKASILSKTHKIEQEALSVQMDARFRTYKKEKLQLLFGLQDVSKVQRVKHYYNYFNAARKGYLDSLSNATKELADNQHALKTQQALLKKLQAEHMQEAQNLMDDKITRKSLLASINKTLSSLQ